MALCARRSARLPRCGAVVPAHSARLDSYTAVWPPQRRLGVPPCGGTAGRGGETLQPPPAVSPVHRACCDLLHAQRKLVAPAPGAPAAEGTPALRALLAAVAGCPIRCSACRRCGALRAGRRDERLH